MKKPMIALTARIGEFQGQNRIFDNQTYFDAVALGGGIPVLVNYGSDEDYEAIAERFDGLLVTGGEIWIRRYSIRALIHPSSLPIRAWTRWILS